MPIYEYRCGQCDDVFEELMKFDDPDPNCPECGGDEVSKLISNTSFQLKGEGWYVTDYKKPASRPSANGKDKASESQGDDSGGSSSSDSQGSSTNGKDGVASAA